MLLTTEGSIYEIHSFSKNWAVNFCWEINFLLSKNGRLVPLRKLQGNIDNYKTSSVYRFQMRAAFYGLPERHPIWAPIRGFILKVLRPKRPTNEWVIQTRQRSTTDGRRQPLFYHFGRAMQICRCKHRPDFNMKPRIGAQIRSLFGRSQMQQSPRIFLNEHITTVLMCVNIKRSSVRVLCV